MSKQAHTKRVGDSTQKTPIETMNISLGPTRQMAQRHIREGGYATASDYVRDLIREKEERKYQEELLRDLAAALRNPGRRFTQKERTDLENKYPLKPRSKKQ